MGSWSIHGYSRDGKSLSGWRLCLRLGHRHREVCVFQRNILFNFFDGELCPRSAAFLRLLDGKGIIDAVHLLVVAVIQLGFLQRAAVKRLGTTDDIAKAAVFLASEDSSWISGESLLVAGGARL